MLTFSSELNLGNCNYDVQANDFLTAVFMFQWKMRSGLLFNSGLYNPFNSFVLFKLQELLVPVIIGETVGFQIADKTKLKQVFMHCLPKIL